MPLCYSPHSHSLQSPTHIAAIRSQLSCITHQHTYWTSIPTLTRACDVDLGRRVATVGDRFLAHRSCPDWICPDIYIPVRSALKGRCLVVQFSEIGISSKEKFLLRILHEMNDGEYHVGERPSLGAKRDKLSPQSHKEEFRELFSSRKVVGKGSTPQLFR